MGDKKHLPCSGCGRDLQFVDTEETTAVVEDKPNPHFSGQEVKEVPALVCPECGETTAL